MTVIAWDGRSIAADRLGSDNGTKMECTKIRKLHSGDILAFTGSYWQQEMLMRWYIAGCKPEEWPEFQQKGDDWMLMVSIVQGRCFRYERGAYPVLVENDYYAWGSGQDYAMGALAMGATARQAVEIASLHSTTCGLGVDVYDIGTPVEVGAIDKLRKSK